MLAFLINPIIFQLKRIIKKRKFVAFKCNVICKSYYMVNIERP
jgi:hypothetical protein